MSNIHSQFLIEYIAHWSHSSFTGSSTALSKATHHWMYFENCSLFKLIVYFKIKAYKTKHMVICVVSILTKWFKNNLTGKGHFRFQLGPVPPTPQLPGWHRSIDPGVSWKRHVFQCHIFFANSLMGIEPKYSTAGRRKSKEIKKSKGRSRSKIFLNLKLWNLLSCNWPYGPQEGGEYPLSG